MTYVIPSFPDYKAGDTASIVGTCVLPDGVWTGTCHMRNRDTDVTVGTWAVQIGEPYEGETPFTLTPVGDTSTWTPVPCLIDLRFTDNSAQVVHTETVGIRIVPPITKASP